MCKENLRKNYNIKNTNQNKYTNSERIKKRKQAAKTIIEGRRIKREQI